MFIIFTLTQWPLGGTGAIYTPERFIVQKIQYLMDKGETTTQTLVYVHITLSLHCFFLIKKIIPVWRLRWHRIAYSVQNKSVTLYLDCQKVETLDLLRGDDAIISTDGVTVFGTRLLDDNVFEVRHFLCCVCVSYLWRVLGGIVPAVIRWEACPDRTPTQTLLT